MSSTFSERFLKVHLVRGGQHFFLQMRLRVFCEIAQPSNSTSGLLRRSVGRDYSKKVSGVRRVIRIVCLHFGIFNTRIHLNFIGERFK